MSILSNKRRVSKLFSQNLARYTAKLGDGLGHLNVPGKNNYVYVRVNGKDLPEPVFCNKIPAQNDLNVLVGWENGLFQVLSTYTDTPGGVNGGSVGGFAPASRYQLTGEDPLWVDVRQITWLRVGPNGGLKVQMRTGLVRVGNNVFYVETDVHDMTSYLPSIAGKAAFIAVTVDSSGAWTFTKGAEFILSDQTTPTLMLSNLPDLPADTIWLSAYVRVYTGQTLIDDVDVIDARFSSQAASEAPVSPGAIGVTYLGYNSIGGSWSGQGQYSEWIKKITVPQAGLLSSIDVYIKGNNNNVFGISPGLFDDYGNSPGNLIIGSVLPGGSYSIYLNSEGRWLSLPVGRWLEPGDYWISVMLGVNGQCCSIAYDAGNDLYRNIGGYYNSDGKGWFSPSNSGAKFSLRAALVS